MAAPERAANKPKADERLKQARVLVDELGSIEKRIATVYANAEKELGSKPLRAAQLRQELLALYENAPPAIPFVADGERFVATLSARSNQTAITSMAKVLKIVGRDKFLGLCTFALGVLRKELTPQQLATCTKTANTGPRSLSVVEREA